MNGVDNPAPRNFWGGLKSEDEAYEARSSGNESAAESTGESDEDDYDADNDDDYATTPVLASPQKREPILELVSHENSRATNNGWSTSRTTISFYSEAEIDEYERHMRAVDPKFTLERRAGVITEGKDPVTSVVDVLVEGFVGLLIGAIVAGAKNAGASVKVTKTKTTE